MQKGLFVQILTPSDNKIPHEHNLNKFVCNFCFNGPYLLIWTPALFIENTNVFSSMCLFLEIIFRKISVSIINK